MKIELIPEEEFPPKQDNFDRLWTPHRLTYVSGKDKIVKKDKKHCPFCLPKHTKDDDKRLIVTRGEHCFVILNLFPYNSGHAMVCPYRHIPNYTDLNKEELSEFAEMTQKLMHVINKTSSPEGFNLGLNQGVDSGAGVSAHLHQHVIPRWRGDTNFMPLIAKAKPMLHLLDDLLKSYQKNWKELYG